jgi:TonB family protein
MIGDRALAVDPARRRVRWTVAVSMVAHAAAGVALLTYSFWKIERLAYKDRSMLSMPGVLGLPPGEPERAPAAPQASRPRKPATPAELTQPREATSPTATEPADRTPSGTTDALGPGGHGDDPEGLATGPGGGGGGPIGLVDPSAVPTEIPAVTPPPPPADASQKEMEARRLAGDGRVLLPSSMLASLKAQGQTHFSVTVKVCVDESGVPSSRAVAQSSGIAEVDAFVMEGTGRWRFAPYTVNGAPVRACFLATLNKSIL